MPHGHLISVCTPPREEATLPPTAAHPVLRRVIRGKYHLWMWMQSWSSLILSIRSLELTGVTWPEWSTHREPFILVFYSNCMNTGWDCLGWYCQFCFLLVFLAINIIMLVILSLQGTLSPFSHASWWSETTPILPISCSAKDPACRSEGLHICYNNQHPFVTFGAQMVELRSCHLEKQLFRSPSCHPETGLHIIASSRKQETASGPQALPLPPPLPTRGHQPWQHITVNWEPSTWTPGPSSGIPIQLQVEGWRY